LLRWLLLVELENSLLQLETEATPLEIHRESEGESAITNLLVANLNTATNNLLC
jgi:hypothetical protein